MATYMIKDICTLLGVHEQTVISWIHNGELKATNVGATPGKKKPRWRITEASLEAFMEKRSTKPPAPKPTRRRNATSQGTVFK